MKNYVPVLLMAALSIISCKEEKQSEPAGEVAVKDTIAQEPVKYADFGMAEDDLPQGLKVGDVAPDVILNTDDKKQLSLKELYTKQPVVVLFYRAYWCPVCIRHLAEFAERAKEIEAAGAKIVIVTPETYENVGKTEEKTSTDFTVISDADESIMKAFDVDFRVTEEYQKMISERLDASVAETNASKEAVLPVPATFIIDTNGKIVYRHFDPNYRNRATVQDILDNLPEKK